MKTICTAILCLHSVMAVDGHAQQVVEAQEPNDSLASATPISSGQEGAGILSGAADRDFWVIDLSEPANLVVALSGDGSAASALDTQLTILDFSSGSAHRVVRRSINIHDPYWAFDTGMPTVRVPVPAGPIVAIVEPAPGAVASQGVGSYRIDVATHAATWGRAASILQEGTEPNHLDATPGPTPVLPAFAATGSIGFVGDRDFYEFTLTEATRLKVNVVGSGASPLGNPRILFSKNGDVFHVEDFHEMGLALDDGQADPDAEFHVDLQPGTYAVGVAASPAQYGAADGVGTGGYTIQSFTFPASLDVGQDCVGQLAATAEPSEPNDFEQGTPGTLSLCSRVSGSLNRAAGDIEDGWFINLLTDTRLHLDLKLLSEDELTGVAIVVLDQNGAPVTPLWSRSRVASDFDEQFGAEMPMGLYRVALLLPDALGTLEGCDYTLDVSGWEISMDNSRVGRATPFGNRCLPSVYVINDSNEVPHAKSVQRCRFYFGGGAFVGGSGVVGLSLLPPAPIPGSPGCSLIVNGPVSLPLVVDPNNLNSATIEIPLVGLAGLDLYVQAGLVTVDAGLTQLLTTNVLQLEVGTPE